MGKFGALALLISMLPGLGHWNLYLVPTMLLSALVGIGGLTRDDEDAHLAVFLNLAVASTGFIRMAIGVLA